MVNAVKRRNADAIEFPANPFVALADFVIVLLLVMILAVLHQSVSCSRLIERMAVAELQQRLLGMCGASDAGLPADSALRSAYNNGDMKQTWVDGDLQRFWLKSTLFFGSGETSIRSQHARDILKGFGSLLKQHQGDLRYPGTGLYKRIIVQGNADRSEGKDIEVWSLSLQRARSAASILQEEANLSPLLIEASGRGCWDPAVPVEPGMTRTQRQEAAVANRRLEIVIVYSGHRAMQYVRRSQARGGDKQP